VSMRWSGSLSGWWNGRSMSGGGWPGRSTTASASASSACSSTCRRRPTRSPAPPGSRRSRWPGPRNWPRPPWTRPGPRSPGCAPRS
jgi:hypothetical protein